MKKILILISLAFILISCDPSQEERRPIAQLTCNIMAATRGMDAAMRIKEINAAREKLGEPIFLGNDEDIKESFTYGLCPELVLNLDYEQYLLKLQTAEIAAELAIKAEREKQEAERKRREKLSRDELLAFYIERDAAKERGEQWAIDEYQTTAENVGVFLDAVDEISVKEEIEKRIAAEESRLKTEDKERDDFRRINFSGNGSITAFTLPREYCFTFFRDEDVAVYIDGVYQYNFNYSIDRLKYGSCDHILTFDTAPPNGSVIEVVFLLMAQ